MSFLSTSQAGQDAWVRSIIPGIGTFLDVGCGDPEAGSNTAGLERDGWTGMAIDRNQDLCVRWFKKRVAPAICHDAVTFPWKFLTVKSYDYLSLDVDEAQVQALTAILLGGVRWRVATIEHDSYRFGPDPRDAIRAMMRDQGYVLARKDVECGGQPFEDWWTDETLDPGVFTRCKSPD